MSVEKHRPFDLQRSKLVTQGHTLISVLVLQCHGLFTPLTSLLFASLYIILIDSIDEVHVSERDIP